MHGSTLVYIYCVALKKYFLHFMLALFRPLCWCFMPWLYSGLYTEGLYHGFILGFILGFMSLGRSVSVASGAVLATAGAHRGATPHFIAIEIQFWGWSRGAGASLGIIQLYSLLYTCFIHLCASVSLSVYIVHNPLQDRKNTPKPNNI